MILYFAKYHGSENDFLIFDDRNSRFPMRDKLYIQSLCKRQTGVGADGIILLQHSEKADLRMRIFNSDGGEVSMCGNGLRCFVDFAHNLGLKTSTVEIGGRILTCNWSSEEITVDLGPYDLQPLALFSLDIHLVHVGVPHAVVFTENHDAFSELAPSIRSHSLFKEEGANVNFAVFKEGKFYTRTFERGVEGETRACGSGAVAVAIAAKQKFRAQNPITIVPLSQEILKVNVFAETAQLSGRAAAVFHGSVSYA